MGRTAQLNSSTAMEGMAKYLEFGGTLQGLKQSLDNMEPLAGLTNEEKKEFTESFTPEELKTFIKARLFYMELPGLRR